mmetsp:Transcript_46388/g.68492  ORF Transcript_46388/g.68492 Transcript_46388/m.68492 type:complete len:339 (-) Transcript_46388:423-1439(-)|eukprot:CAMPEP_0195520380 /NCGR_PEP_ID=MMETSP0794_2-20130614/16740_1 /TAXON_ID=515487 /ORGANISM="Stephanopyxis turris, Strain CCMP 815" /LENGTH=338 /DNA_ID=CAMNT_0040649725 /DNA_START=131 /DNA_END=1147 /DNA_ORIENTATION=+
MSTLKQRTQHVGIIVDLEDKDSSTKEKTSVVDDDKEKKTNKSSTYDCFLNVAIIVATIFAIASLSLSGGSKYVQNLRKAVLSGAPSNDKAATPEVPSTTETITAEELSKLLQGKENIALGKSAAQSSTGNGEAKPPASELGDCGCPLTCDSAVLATANPDLPYSCGQRIAYLITTHGDPRDKACKAASEANACVGDKCHPEKCPKPEAGAGKGEILGDASKALDGDKNHSYDGKSVTATNEEANPWWQVDLGGVHTIEHVVLYNRMDCCSDRLKNFHVELMDQNKEGAWEVTADVKQDDEAGPITLTKFKEGSKGKIVRVRLEGTGVLSLAEVEVYGK